MSARTLPCRQAFQHLPCILAEYGFPFGAGSPCSEGVPEIAVDPAVVVMLPVLTGREALEVGKLVVVMVAINVVNMPPGRNLMACIKPDLAM
jgi:hypothetical protein